MTKQPSFFTFGGSVFYSLSNRNKNLATPTREPSPVADVNFKAQSIKSLNHKK